MKEKKQEDKNLAFTVLDLFATVISNNWSWFVGAGIIGSIIYFQVPRTIEDPKIVKFGIYQNTFTYCDYAGPCDTEEVKAPCVYVDNHPKCLMSDSEVDKLCIGDKIKSIKFKPRPFTECDILSSFKLYDEKLQKIRENSAFPCDTNYDL
ncbi:hypothetical protein HOK51_03660 [Candidatus Woesearchaeota archaeon]|jgi:hypothetical protein|nr:hypothetical protein [Candidatus Woesearchaeota archaeon]MBT6518918.1 hypothetical protein [Candidatus Woesearchaeota archaeon]MBT7367586.1 hypothetical protein [Candidatus Woesearchaeota archaeon]